MEAYVHGVSTRAVDDIVELAGQVDLIAVDSPFGWPAAFVDALAAHQAGEPWPAGADRDPLRHRVTDIRVRETIGLWPLSVSTDMLGVTALRCAHLQDRLAREVWGGEAAARDGSGALVEVYPAGALKLWELTFRGYKGRDGESARREMMARLAAAVSGRAGLAPLVEAAIASDHVLDAIVCALVGAAVAEGSTRLPDRSLRTSSTSGFQRRGRRGEHAPARPIASHLEHERIPEKRSPRGARACPTDRTGKRRSPRAGSTCRRHR